MIKVMVYAANSLATRVYVEVNACCLTVCIKACNATVGLYAGTSWPAPDTIKYDSLPAVLNMPYCMPWTVYGSSCFELKAPDSENSSLDTHSPTPAVLQIQSTVTK